MGWNLWVLLPLRILVVVFHEAGHALVALATGGRVVSITVDQRGRADDHRGGAADPHLERRLPRQPLRGAGPAAPVSHGRPRALRVGAARRVVGGRGAVVVSPGALLRLRLCLAGRHPAGRDRAARLAGPQRLAGAHRGSVQRALRRPRCP
ncbi:MAG: hypothetical protein GXP62_04755 [Oligoflexia bacterium]|nr:hypothetical protein [Oligoflexia bacterium]